MGISKKFLVPGVVGLAAFAGVAGASALSSLPVSADSTTATTAAAGTATTAASTSPTAAAGTSATSPAAQHDPSQGGHVGTNGTKEVLLTGDTATKAKAAAAAAVPGGTVQRVENDAEGAIYEAHVAKSDGSQVTIKMDADFKVTGIETGGPGGHGSTSPSSTTNP